MCQSSSGIGIVGRGSPCCPCQRESVLRESRHLPTSSCFSSSERKVREILQRTHTSQYTLPNYAGAERQRPGASGRHRTRSACEPPRSHHTTHPRRPETEKLHAPHWTAHTRPLGLRRASRRASMSKEKDQARHVPSASLSTLLSRRHDPVTVSAVAHVYHCPGSCSSSALCLRSSHPHFRPPVSASPPATANYATPAAGRRAPARSSPAR